MTTPVQSGFLAAQPERIEPGTGQTQHPLADPHSVTLGCRHRRCCSTCASRLKIEAVHVNEEYGINESRRDEAVAQALKAEGIDFYSYLDQLLFRPGTVLTKTGTYFQVFSQFRKVCYDRLHRSLPERREPPGKSQAPLDIASDEIPARVEGFDSTDRQFARPLARRRSRSPAPSRHVCRRANRLLPERARLPCQAWHQSTLGLSCGRGDFPTPVSAHGAAKQSGRVRKRQGRLQSPGSTNCCGASSTNTFWWATHGFPVTALSARRQKRWPGAMHRMNSSAWQEARTGLPIIDAAMRQLLETGWMHNRLRMVVAMFLTKNLLIDWREGERFFMRHLIDGDLAANNGGWQWSSSTGTDSAPYFRIFNPLSQSEKFDAEGVFIKHWLPELAGLNKKEVHNPANFGGLFGIADYPSPIVNLSTSRQRALAAFKNLPSRQAAGGGYE